MTVIIPDDYHARDLLIENGITCISHAAARKQDIRPLRIGILNIMPVCEDYEFNLLHPLGLSIIQVEPVWIKLKSHNYQSSDQEHVEEFYATYEQATKNAALDGLIVTGAPVEQMEFKDVKYWEEIQEILTHSRIHTPSTLGICWGAFALAKMEGIDKFNYQQKLFGVFELHNLTDQHPITGELDDRFWCPQSRHAGIEDYALEQAQREGRIKLLAFGPDCGYAIFETTDHRYVMHTGHPEYNSHRLVYEAQRDRLAGLKEIPSPANFDPLHPINRWKSARNIFFTQWLKYCYLCISTKENL